MDMQTFDFELLAAVRGSKHHGFLDIGAQADGSMTRIPYVIAVGKYDGPTLLMDGGIHGDEVEGADAIAHVFKEINTDELRGIYLGVPHLNLEGFNIGKRVGSSLDYTATDMNRVFPGDDVHGKLSTYIVAKYVEYFVSHADYWVTFHSGGNTLYIEPMGCYTNPELDEDFGDLTLRMCKCFHTKFLWRNDPGNKTEGKIGTTMRELSEINKIAYICLEMGGNTTLGKEREKIYKQCHDGIEELMRLINMMPGDVKPFREDSIYCPVDYLHITHGGIFHPSKEIGEYAKKGEELGYITNLWGDTIDQCIAPYDGVVVGLWTPPVIQPREWAVLFGKTE